MFLPWATHRAFQVYMLHRFNELCSFKSDIGIVLILALALAIIIKMKLSNYCKISTPAKMDNPPRINIKLHQMLFIMLYHNPLSHQKTNFQLHSLILTHSTVKCHAILHNFCCSPGYRYLLYCSGMIPFCDELCDRKHLHCLYF